VHHAYQDQQQRWAYGWEQGKTATEMVQISIWTWPVTRQDKCLRYKEDFLLIYKMYMQPRMEYCVQEWSLHLKKVTECL